MKPTLAELIAVLRAARSEWNKNRNRPIDEHLAEAIQRYLGTDG